jgi:hypothetical protein
MEEKDPIFEAIEAFMDDYRVNKCSILATEPDMI